MGRAPVVLPVVLRYSQRSGTICLHQFAPEPQKRHPEGIAGDIARTLAAAA
jgi:hypothetical protein